MTTISKELQDELVASLRVAAKWMRHEYSCPVASQERHIADVGRAAPRAKGERFDRRRDALAATIKELQSEMPACKCKFAVVQATLAKFDEQTGVTS